MGFLDRFRSQPPQSNGNTAVKLRPLEEILEEVDIVHVGEGFIVASRRTNEMMPLKPFAFSHPVVEEGPPHLQELGSASTRWNRVLGGQEYNADVRGLAGLEKYDRMRRGDGTVIQALRIAKTPVLQGRWWVDSAEPGNPLHDEIAEFVGRSLFEWQSIGWTQFLTEALLMIDFGYYFFEKVNTFHIWKDQQRVIWKKFAPRSPFDVVEWLYDSHGGVESVDMYNFDGERNINIPIRNLLVFTLNRETGNVEGISGLRPMYKHWYYKENLYKIDAIKAERHGIGIPVIVLPPNWTNTDKTLADELGRNLRTNEQAHVVLPPLWDLHFAELEGQQIDIMNSITHHDNKMLDSVLASFIREQRTQGAEVALDIFMKSSRYIADIIREVVNKYAIPELVNWNWMNVDVYPELKVRRIGEVADLRTLSFMARNLVGARIVEPDDRLEEYLRKEIDFPVKDETSVREVETPQLGPGRTGMPRQGPPSARQGAGTGEDRSGTR